MDVIKKRVTKDAENGKMITVLKRGETLTMNGPSQIEVMSPNHDGHKDQVRIAVTAPRSTRIEKNK